jgi:hypothetical protein
VVFLLEQDERSDDDEEEDEDEEDEDALGRVLECAR